MPKVGKKEFAYTAKGMAMAKMEAKKTGKKMASLTLADTSRDLHSITVFPTSFAKAYMNLEEGKSYKFGFGKTKDGTVTLEDIHVS